MEPKQEGSDQRYFQGRVFVPGRSFRDGQPSDEKNQEGGTYVNQDIEKVIAERILLSPLVVQRKTQAIDMAIADVRQAGVIIHIGYLWCSINMSFIIALEGSV